MSASTSPSDAPVRLQVDTQSPDAEVFLIDHQLQMTARSVGSMDLRVQPGVYKIKVRQARDVREQMLMLTEDTRIAWPAPDIASPIPIRGNSRAQDRHAVAAEQQSAKTDLSRGAGARLFLMSRLWSADSPNTPPPGGMPGKGVSIGPWNDAWRVGIDEAGAGEAGPDAWRTLSLDVDPGAYSLQIRGADGRLVEQAVIASAGWQTQVFLLHRAQDPNRGANDDTALTALPGVSVSMSRSSFHAESEQARLSELARIALADERPVLATQLRSLFDEKSENPIFGLLGCHLQLLMRRQTTDARLRRQRQREVSASVAADADLPDFDADQFDQAIRHLRRMLGPAHPDVEALSLQCADSTLHTTGTFDVPPMFRRGWALMVEASNAKPEMLGADLWERTAQRLGTQPFLRWICFSESDGSRESFYEAVRQNVKERAGQGQGAAAMAAPSPFESTQPKPVDADEVASLDLGIPRSVIERFRSS